MRYNMQFPSYITGKLKFYVYLYIDPRNNRIFYIGKGKGNRALSHLYGSSDTAKTNRIKTIRKAGLKPRIEFLRFGLTGEEAKLVEATAIDLIGKNNLANIVRGFESTSFGRTSIEEVVSWYKAKSVKIQHRVILIIINKRYYHEITDEELYEATRGIWKIGINREKAEYAFAVYQGIVKEVYKILEWHKAGTLHYKTRQVDKTKLKGRWEFIGKVAPPKVNKLYKGGSVREYLPKGTQNPIKYVNI